jgi:hypothetical protein
MLPKDYVKSYGRSLLKILKLSDYLVITCKETIVCVSLETIDRVNNEVIHGRTYIERLHEKNLIEAKVIHMSMLFDSDTIDAGLLVSEVSESQCRHVDLGKKRKNVIQISTITNLLVWDVDDMEEVTCLRGYDQFIGVQNFVRTGLNLYIPI